MEYMVEWHVKNMSISNVWTLHNMTDTTATDDVMCEQMYMYALYVVWMNEWKKKIITESETDILSTTLRAYFFLFLKYIYIWMCCLSFKLNFLCGCMLDINRQQQKQKKVNSNHAKIVSTLFCVWSFNFLLPSTSTEFAVQLKLEWRDCDGDWRFFKGWFLMKFIKLFNFYASSSQTEPFLQEMAW